MDPLLTFYVRYGDVRCTRTIQACQQVAFPVVLVLCLYSHAIQPAQCCLQLPSWVQLSDPGAPLTTSRPRADDLRLFSVLVPDSSSTPRCLFGHYYFHLRIYYTIARIYYNLQSCVNVLCITSWATRSDVTNDTTCFARNTRSHMHGSPVLKPNKHLAGLPNSCFYDCIWGWRRPLRFASQAAESEVADHVRRTSWSTPRST